MNDRATHLPHPAASPLLPGQPDPALPAGMRLGAFELHRVIARSANAVVYLATDHALAMPVAIQEFLPARLVRRDAGLSLIAAADWNDDLIARGLRAFVGDARMLARCEHPSLVRVHQLFHSHGSAYRVMPVYTGQSLLDLRREMVGAPDEASLRSLLEGLLGAIEAIHRSGQVHGEVSARNILLLADDRPLLLGPGAAAREMGNDLIDSLMATLESPSGAASASEVEGGTPATGVALDLYGLAEVMRFCICAEPPAPRDVVRPREPLASVIARTFPAGTRPQYSAALLGALDAAVSPFAQDRPLTAAQFRDWLARGVPGVPGGGPVRAKPPTAADRAGTPPAPIASPTPAPRSAPPPPGTAQALPLPAPVPPPKPSPLSAPAGGEPIAPWPDFASATGPQTSGHEDAGPDRAPLPPQWQDLASGRRRSYKWLLGAALALLAAGVLSVVTGAWNRAPAIALGPETEHIGAAPPAVPARDAPVANTAPAAQAAAMPDPAQVLAEQPPAAGPTQPAQSESTAPAAPAAPPEQAALAASRAPSEPSEPSEPSAPSAPTASLAPPTLPAPAKPFTRASAAPPTSGPRTACSGRTEFALYRCMLQQCQAKRWVSNPQCVKFRRDDRVD